MILFMDDEPGRVRPWVVALERAFGAGFVRLVPSAGLVLDELADLPVRSLDLFVCDLMLPTPAQLDDTEAEFGTRTGQRVFERFREKFPDVPAVVLTNARDDALFEQFQGPLNWAYRKRDLVPTELVALARRLGVRNPDHEP